MVVAVVMGIAFALTLIVRPAGHSFANSIALTPVERGRRVYIAEGCINCHSQYVRPNTADVPMWGPVTSLEEIRREQPPLIGNRRQGPDLSQVGARRSPLWLRIHFMNPRDVSYDSIMPRYDYLFRDGRGDDLIAYLCEPQHPGALAYSRRLAAFGLRDCARPGRLTAVCFSPSTALPVTRLTVLPVASGWRVFTAFRQI